MSRFDFDRMLVCGVGLIGSSVARGLRRAHRDGRAGGRGWIVGADPDAATLQRALALGVIDEAILSGPAGLPPEAAADIIVLAAPVAQTRPLLEQLLPYLPPQAVLTDVGSTKQEICLLARACLGAQHTRFVAGHPIAGGESSGVEAGTDALFVGRDVILCPDTDTDADARERVAAMWQVLGARLANMSAAHHDQLFAGVSHLPHLLAFAFIEHILETDNPAERLAFAGAGFRDFTRIAASSPAMWRDICLANRAAILAEYDHYLATLTTMRAALAAADGAALEALFSRSRAARGDWQQGHARGVTHDQTERGAGDADAGESRPLPPGH